MFSINCNSEELEEIYGSKQREEKGNEPSSENSENKATGEGIEDSSEMTTRYVPISTRNG